MDRMDRIQKLYERVGNCHAFADYWFRPRFVCWDAQKIPYTPSVDGGTLQRASSTNPDTWGDMPAAIATLYRHPDQLMGIGLVLNGDGLVCIDLDKCVDDDGTISPEAQRVLGIFANTYAEYSPSGRGIHIWLRTSTPLPADGKRTGGIEIYQSKRYITITGNKLPNHPDQIADCTEQLHDLYRELFGDTNTHTPACDDDECAELNPQDLDGELIAWAITDETTDDELIQAFLTERENVVLWAGGRLAHHQSDSEADCALAYRLLWLVDGDTARAERLFRSSPRSRREKLVKRGDDLIPRAVRAAYQYYTAKQMELAAKRVARLQALVADPLIAHAALCEHDFGSEAYCAELCERILGGKILYHQLDDEWYCYDDLCGIWERDKHGSRINRLIMDLLRQHFEVVPKHIPHYEEQAAKCLRKYSRIDQVSIVRKHLTTIPTLWTDGSVFDQPEVQGLLIPLENGVWDVARGELLPHSPDYYFTRTLNARYDPTQSTPHWDRALDDWCWDDSLGMPNNELREYLLHALGYTLTGSVREQKLFIIHGPGATGKSTLLTVIQHIMGDWGITIHDDVITEQRGNSMREIDRMLAPVKGRRFVLHPELGNSVKLSTERIKRVVSTEAITIRKLYKEVEWCKPMHKIWVCTNDLPETDDSALWRRVVVIPFLSVFDESANTLYTKRPPDKDLLVKLVREADGIATQLCHYATRWFQNGLPECETIKEYTRFKQHDSDPFEAWFESCVVPAPNNLYPKDDAYKHYKEFVRELDEKPLDISTWGKRLKQKGVESTRRRTGNNSGSGSDRKRYLVGITLQ